MLSAIFCVIIIIEISSFNNSSRAFLASSSLFTIIPFLTPPSLKPVTVSISPDSIDISYNSDITHTNISLILDIGKSSSLLALAMTFKFLTSTSFCDKNPIIGPIPKGFFME